MYVYVIHDFHNCSINKIFDRIDYSKNGKYIFIQFQDVVISLALRVSKYLQYILRCMSC